MLNIIDNLYTWLHGSITHSIFQLTTHHIKSINREIHQLSSSLVKRLYQPDHCDLYLVDDKEDKLYDVPVVKDEMELRHSDDFSFRNTSANNRELGKSFMNIKYSKPGSARCAVFVCTCSYCICHKGEPHCRFILLGGPIFAGVE